MTNSRICFTILILIRGRKCAPFKTFQFSENVVKTIKRPGTKQKTIANPFDFFFQLTNMTKTCKQTFSCPFYRQNFKFHHVWHEIMMFVKSVIVVFVRKRKMWVILAFPAIETTKTLVICSLHRFG